MKGRQITGLILIVAAFGLGIYDVVIGSLFGAQTTLSWVIYTCSLRYPAIPFGAGFLCGHLFAQMHGTPRN